MRRTLVASFMIAGLLLQASAVVRHATMSIARGLSPTLTISLQILSSQEERALAADLVASICQPDAQAEHSVPAGNEGSPQSDMSGCPICNGLVSAFALAAASEQIGRITFRAGVIEFELFDQRLSRHAFLRPQGRAPPPLA